MLTDKQIEKVREWCYNQLLKECAEGQEPRPAQVYKMAKFYEAQLLNGNWVLPGEVMQ